MAPFYEGLSRAWPRRCRWCGGAGRCQRRSSGGALHVDTSGAPPGFWQLRGPWAVARAGAAVASVVRVRKVADPKCRCPGTGRPRWMTETPRGALPGSRVPGRVRALPPSSWPLTCQRGRATLFRAVRRPFLSHASPRHLARTHALKELRPYCRRAAARRASDQAPHPSLRRPGRSWKT